ncbi:hypothetical protein [Streptomyces sp. NPDC003036]|uniref:hypothetical protein n=1 Tax=Streptomyces sp. NPDC003036 TaxID=3154442 RepID=UPI0033ADAA6B
MGLHRIHRHAGERDHAVRASGLGRADVELAGAEPRARRSATRADHQAATALRKAAKELAYASNEPGGLAIALLFATVYLARAASIRSTLAIYQRRKVPGAADLARRAREALA